MGSVNSAISCLFKNMFWEWGPEYLRLFGLGCALWSSLFRAHGLLMADTLWSVATYILHFLSESVELRAPNELATGKR